MKQNRHYSKLYRYMLSSFVVVAILVVAFSLVMTKHNHTDAAPAVKPAIGAAVKSQFSFGGATDWWQGATNGTSMALFHSYDCFTSVEHKAGTIDTSAELQKTQASLISSGYTVTPGSTKILTIQTTTGRQQYELHQTSVTTPSGASKVEGGQELGYLQLSSGYLFIQGNCDTTAELSTTIPALQAIKFDESK